MRNGLLQVCTPDVLILFYWILHGCHLLWIQDTTCVWWVEIDCHSLPGHHSGCSASPNCIMSHVESVCQDFLEADNVQVLALCTRFLCWVSFLDSVYIYINVLSIIRTLISPLSECVWNKLEHRLSVCIYGNKKKINRRTLILVFT